MKNEELKLLFTSIMNFCRPLEETESMRERDVGGGGIYVLSSFNVRTHCTKYIASPDHKKSKIKPHF